MRALARMMMAAGVLALCGGTAMAQPGGGFGGFGGGQVNLRTGVFTNKVLQEELKITDDQAVKLKEFTAKQTEAMKPFMPAAPVGGQPGGGGRPGGGGAAGGGRPGGGGFAAPVQRDDEEQLKFLKVQVTMLEERMAVTKSTLTAEQVKRLAQLENQQLGVNAYSNVKVAKALDLSEEQAKKIKELNDEMAKERREMQMGMGGGGGFDREAFAEMQKKIKNLTDETAEKMEKTLSAEQKSKWKEMTGEAFDLTKLNPAPPKKDM